MKPRPSEPRRPGRSAGAARCGLALALLLTLPAQAREVARDDAGAVLEVSGFYKNLLTAVALQPDQLRAARAYAELLAQSLPGVVPAQATAIPSGGAVDAHLVRIGSRFRYLDRLEVEVAWQLAYSLASDPAFVGGATVNGASAGGTGGGTAAVAQRRLVPLGGVLSQGPGWRLEHDVDRLSIKVPLPFGDLTLGRQVLSWGTGRFWNPTDVLSPFPPTAVDRDVRRGFDAARLAVALSEVSQLDLVYLPQPEAAEMGGVARLQLNVMGWDGSLSVGKYVRDLVFGADVVGDLGPFGVHAEGAYTLELLGLGGGDVTVGERFFRGVVGAELRPHEKLLLLAEYAFNGYGTTDPSRYAAVLTSPRVVRGEIFGAGKHQAALAATFLASDLLSAQLSVIGNLTDPSALLIPSLEYSFTQTVLIRAGAYVPLGRGTDPHAYDGFTPADVLSGSEAFRAATEGRGLRSEYGSTPFGAFVQIGLHVP